MRRKSTFAHLAPVPVIAIHEAHTSIHRTGGGYPPVKEQKKNASFEIIAVATPDELRVVLKADSGIT